MDQGSIRYHIYDVNDQLFPVPSARDTDNVNRELFDSHSKKK